MKIFKKVAAIYTSIGAILGIADYLAYKFGLKSFNDSQRHALYKAGYGNRKQMVLKYTVGLLTWPYCFIKGLVYGYHVVKMGEDGV